MHPLATSVHQTILGWLGDRNLCELLMTRGIHAMAQHIQVWRVDQIFHLSCQGAESSGASHTDPVARRRDLH